MDLELSVDDARFRDEVRAFLDEALTPELRDAGRLATSLFSDRAHSLPWQRILHRRGWAAPSWPEDYGGPGWSEMQRYIFAAECARADAPRLSPMGLRMVAPCIMRYGTEAQKRFFLPRILSGEDYWCQGYSEPGSGSDLASLQLRAVRDGDAYVLNGSKIWTTHAHWANRMFCLVRTRDDGKPQTGITFLLLEMDTPGLSVEPIITLAGDHEVNQVFFDDVRVPVEGRLGEENDGWSVAKYLLEFERGGADWAAALKASLVKLRAAAEEAAVDDRAIWARIAASEIEVDAIEMTERRVMSALATGANPGPASSMLKALGTEALQRIDELSLEVAGVYGGVDQLRADGPGFNGLPIWPTASLVAAPRYLNNRAASIYGGTNEVQRNIVARAVLGL